MILDMVPARMLVLHAADAGAVRTAREFLTGVCADHHGSGVLADARLLVSELVTNAVVHGGAPIEVEVWCAPGRGLKVWVRDPGPGVPRLRVAGPHEEGGRGLALVRTLSEDWGISAGPTGKTVWFHLSADRDPDQPAD